TQDAIDATTDAVTATQNALSATQDANAATDAANTATTNAINATSDANDAADNANQSASAAQSLVDTSVHLGEYDPATSYVVNNEVRYQGSSWRCLQNSQGNEPMEGMYWTLVARRGVDGEGSVSTINAIPPDETGNVTLTANDIGAE